MLGFVLSGVHLLCTVLVGMQLFGNKFQGTDADGNDYFPDADPNDRRPRATFDGFWWAFLTLMQILTRVCGHCSAPGVGGGEAQACKYGFNALVASEQRTDQGMRRGSIDEDPFIKCSFDDRTASRQVRSLRCHQQGTCPANIARSRAHVQMMCARASPDLCPRLGIRTQVASLFRFHVCEFAMKSKPLANVCENPSHNQVCVLPSHRPGGWSLSSK